MIRIGFGFITVVKQSFFKSSSYSSVLCRNYYNSIPDTIASPTKLENVQST